MVRALCGAPLILCLVCGVARAIPLAAPPGVAPSIVRVSSPMPFNIPSDSFEPGPEQMDMMHKTTVSGATLMLVTIVSYKRDCSAGDPAQMKVLTPPNHGQIVIRQGNAYPGHRHNLLESDCSGTELPATIVYYRSVNGFTGHDTAVLRRYSSDGSVRTMHFDVSVE